MHIPSEQYNNIQSLRGISALAVLLYHLGQTELVLWPNASFHFLYLFSLIGHVGVDLFFVISGFVMVVANHKNFGKANEIGKYLVKRLIRIYPLFWLVCLPQLIWLLFHEKIPFGDLYRALLLIPPHTWKISYVAWTLSYEVGFYLLFIVTLLFSYRWLPAFLFTWAGLILIADRSSYLSNMPDWISDFYTFINITFIYGAFIAICTIRKIYMPIKPALIAAALILSSAAFLKTQALVNFDNDFHHRLIFFGIPSVLILIAAITAEKRLGLFLPTWLEQIGNASYSIYLTHLLFIIHTKFWACRFPGIGLHALWIALMLMGTVALGLIVHHFLEKPLLKGLRGLLSERNQQSPTRSAAESVSPKLVSAT